MNEKVTLETKHAETNEGRIAALIEEVTEIIEGKEAGAGEACCTHGSCSHAICHACSN